MLWFNAPQNAICHLGCQGTMLIHIKPIINHHPWVFICKGCSPAMHLPIRTFGLASLQNDNSIDLFSHYTKNFHLNYFMTEENQLLYFKSTELKEDYASGEFDAPFQILFQKQFREKETMALHNNCVESHFRVISAPICSLLLKSIASKKKKKKLCWFIFCTIM